MGAVLYAPGMAHCAAEVRTAPAPKASTASTHGERGLLAKDFQGFEPFELQGFAFPCEAFELLVLLSEGVEV